jgi:ribosome maturation factor RimP
MSALEAKLQPLAEKAAAAHGLNLVCVRLTGGGKYMTVQVLLETPEGEGPLLDDCAKVSRALAAMLDETDPIKSRYTLEVGSPGLERPLLKPADYQRFVGKQARVSFNNPVEVGKVSLGAFTGVIEQATDSTVVLVNGPERAEVGYKNIRQGQLDPSAAELAAYMKAKAQGSKIN